MSEAYNLASLARLSLAEPEKGAAAVIEIDPPLSARWMLLALVVAIGTLMAYLLPLLSGADEALPTPISAAMLQGVLNLAAVGLIAGVGRMFGGRGTFEDALLLVGWLQVIMLGLQALQLVALLILPPFASIVMFASIVLFFWMLVGFIRTLHGFQSRLGVLMATLGTLFLAAFVFSIVLLTLGFELPGMGDV
ncbi:YIP1 family protein [Pararhodobacter sp. SW119]|uniref:YIP1 family protein n=1 Tax=Pararhodobacter sp. SW119 TaxID=2780075 RepID=UPI001AE06B9A|nr:YIP1 family protein [Pararhodobacter sp. SW119]